MTRGKKRKSKNQIGGANRPSPLPTVPVKDILDESPGLTFNPSPFPGAQHPLTIRDVQQLILWVVGNWIQVSPRWVFVRNKSRIPKVVVLIFPCLSKILWDQSVELGNVMEEIFQSAGILETQAPGSKYRIYPAIETLLNVPTGKQQSKEKRIKVTDRSQPCEVRSFTLSSFERSINEYPLRDQITGNPEWFELPEHPSEYKVVGIDCEMCDTSEGGSLTRVSVVGDKGVILDELVMPSLPIIDYKTRFSGIDKETLVGVTTTLKDVQQRLSSLLSRDTVIVGHSLENDLKALKLYHEQVVDTSLLYPHRQGLPYKNSLRYLTQKYLNREIQQQNHDSIEDAKAALELAELKTQKSASLGDPEAESGETESLFVRLARDWETPLPAAQDNPEPPAADKKPFVIADCTNWNVHKHRSEFVDLTSCQEDDELQKAVLSECSQEHRKLIMAQYDALREHFNQANKVIQDPDREQLMAIVGTYARYIKEVHDSLPSGSMLVVTGLHGDFLKATRELKKKNDTALWTIDQDLALQQTIHNARITKTAFAIKK